MEAQKAKEQEKKLFIPNFDIEIKVNSKEIAKIKHPRDKEHIYQTLTIYWFEDEYSKFRELDKKYRINKSNLIKKVLLSVYQKLEELETKGEKLGIFSKK